jgi:FHS family L-fucose permease-like MFS transporter
MTDHPKHTNYPALYTLITVFFFWGFIAAGNSIFIPFCKSYFSLDQFQSQLVDFAFYTAYYIGALLLFIFSAFSGSDLIGKWGYKNSIVYGLLFSAVGAGAMIIAVEANLYAGMLTGLFIVALGFSLQQTAANPFAVLLGDPKTGTGRVNLGGGINSFGTTIGPLIVGFALFGTTASVKDEQIADLELDKVIYLYMGVGLLFVAAATLFFFSKKVPHGRVGEPIEKANKAMITLLLMTILLAIFFTPVFSSYKSEEALKINVMQKQITSLEKQDGKFSNTDTTTVISEQIATLQHQSKLLLKPLEHQRIIWLTSALIVVVTLLLFAKFKASKNPQGWGAMKYPQLVLGMLAIFTYVGVEVAIGSNLGELLKLPEFGSLQSSEIAPYVSMYWGSLMIGRWAGAVSVFHLSGNKKAIALIAIPLIAFSVIVSVNIMAQKNMTPLYYYVFCVGIQIVAFFICKDKPARTLTVFSILGIVAMVVGLMSTGTIAIYAFLSGGLACSIMWPAIFSLSIIGLGKYTAQGSSFLIMMILGGGIIPPIQGKLSDIIGIHESYSIAVVCFAYLAFFAVAVKSILRSQNIEIDNIESVHAH